MSPRILIFGSNGQIGWQLQRALAPIGEVIAHGRSTCDITRPEKLREIIAVTQPQIIVNAAAYTSVDKAEKDSANTYRLNATAVGILTELALASKALLVHYSTDYVFDGDKPSAYIETDTPTPLSVYGSSKLQGEQAIIGSGCDHLIFRTSWVFGARGSNFIKTILRLAKERTSLQVVADQWGAPTSAELIADVTAHALREVLANRATGGLYHLTAAGKTSWHEYANFILGEAEKYGVSLKATFAQPIAATEYLLAARRPANSLLDTSKLRKAFNLSLPDWRYHVRRTLAELLESE